MSLRTYRICLTEPRRQPTLMGIIRRTESELASAGRRRIVVLPPRRGAFA
jgi:hypothetical protein